MDWMTEPQIEELVNFQYADDEQALKELMEEEEFKFDSYLNSDIDYLSLIHISEPTRPY